MQCKPIVAKASLKKAYGLSTEPLCKIKVGDICTVLFSISNVRKWSFWKWNRRRKETSYFLVEDNCITIVKFTYLLFSTFFLFFQIGNVDPDSRILLFPGSEKYGIIEFLELIMCLQRKTRENRYSCWFNYKVFRFFFFDVRILNIYIF